MAALLAQFSLETIIIISIAALVGAFKLYSWAQKMYQKKLSDDAAKIQQGRELQKRDTAQEERFEGGEARIAKLETAIVALTNIANKQQDQIDLLIQSDELNIKTWMKEQHEKWMPKGFIDNYTYDLLEQRYAIYTKEGGNSWAEKIMSDLRSLPVVTIVPVVELDTTEA